jgi:drug/metabolite transporter (DMT)-like permease
LHKFSPGLKKIKAEAWVLLIVLSLIWGSSFILMKKGLEAYPPMQMASLRICIAALCLLPVAIRHIRSITRKQFFYIMLFGLTNAGLPAFLFAESETVVSSSTAGILNSLTPIFTFLVGVIFFRIVFNWNGLAGVLIGFAGACLLIFYGKNAGPSLFSANSEILYAAMIVVATICYGFASNIIKAHLQQVPGYVVSAYSYLVFAFPLSIWLLFFSTFPSILTHHPEGVHSLLFISILAIMGSALAIILVVRLIQVSSALFGSFVTYLIPVVAIGWGLLSNESVTYVTIISLLVIITGIIVASMKKSPASVTNNESAT